MQTIDLTGIWFRIGQLTRHILHADRAYLVLHNRQAESPVLLADDDPPRLEWLRILPPAAQWLPRQEAVLRTASLDTHSDLLTALRRAGVEALVSAPLAIPQGVIGWLVAGYRGHPPAVAVTPGVMTHLVEGVSLFLAGGLQVGQVQQRYRALHEIGMQIQIEVEPDKVLQLVVKHARDLLQTDMAYIALVDDATKDLTLTVSVGLRSDVEARQQRFSAGVGLIGTAYQQGRPMVVENYALHPYPTTPLIQKVVATDEIAGIAVMPMTRDGRVIGVLVVANRRPTQFRADEIELLTALAAQASIAVENARLYQSQITAREQLRQMAVKLEDQVQQLERSMFLHQQLAAVALSGQGIREIAITLCGLVGRSVCVVQGMEPHHILWSHPDGREHADPGAAALVKSVVARLTNGTMDGEPPWRFSGPAPEQIRLVGMPILAGGQVLGCLCIIETPAPMQEVEVQALEHAVTVLALELSRQRAALETEVRLRGDLLDDLLRRRYATEEYISNRAAHLGISLAELRRVLVLQLALGAETAGGGMGVLSPEARARVLRVASNLLEPITRLVAWRSGRVVALIPPRQRTDRIDAVLRGVQERLRAGKPALYTSIGIGSTVTDLGDLERSYREAVVAVELARRLRAPEAILEYPKLGFFRVLADLPDPSQAVGLVREILGPVKAYDDRHDTDMLQTLRVYVEHDGQLKAASDAYHIHVNSLKYRLDRIGRLLGTDARSSEARFQYNMAFRMLDFLTAMGISPWEEPRTGLTQG